jgi:hypothetical protein
MVSIDGLNYSFGSRLPADADKCTQFILLRLLLGTANVTKGGITTRQRVNYSVFPATHQPERWTAACADLSASYGVNVRTSTFVARSYADNRVFFRDILNEFSHYFLQSSKGCHLAAFVSLYRILERFSYSIPLLYCSTQRDFSKTFNDLKKCFSEKDAGELSLFNTFIRDGGLIDKTVLDTVCDINFASATGLEGKYFVAAEKCFNGFDQKDSSRAYLGLQFMKVGKLIAGVRNRFFHLLSGGWQNNISLTDIWDADEFFESMNPVFCNFLSIVVISVLLHKYAD